MLQKEGFRYSSSLHNTMYRYNHPLHCLPLHQATKVLSVTWRPLKEQHVVAAQAAAHGGHLAGIVVALHRRLEGRRHLHQRRPTGELPIEYLSAAAGPNLITAAIAHDASVAAPQTKPVRSHNVFRCFLTYLELLQCCETDPSTGTRVALVCSGLTMSV